MMSDTLAAVGQSLNDFESVSFLLAGLGSEYDPFVTSVTTHVDPLSLKEIFGHLLAHEMRIEQNLPSTELTQPSANFSAQSNTPRGRGYRGRGFQSSGVGFPRGRGHGPPSSGRSPGSYFSNNSSTIPRLICQLCI